MTKCMENGGDVKATKTEKKAGAIPLLKKVDKKASAEKAVPMAKAVVDDSEPTAKELKELEQIKKDRDQQRDEDRAATRPKKLDYADPFKDGGMVSKGRGNGIAIRGIRKCKMS